TAPAVPRPHSTAVRPFTTSHARSTPRMPRTKPGLERLEDRLAMTGPYGTLPATTGRIHLFPHQLAPGLPDAMVRFLATRHDRAQKMLGPENARYAAVNPNWFLLNYRLATSSGPVAYIHNGTWSSDWPDVTSHEDWFMHNPDGLRLHNDPSNWDLHDIN